MFHQFLTRVKQMEVLEEQNFWDAVCSHGLSSCHFRTRGIKWNSLAVLQGLWMAMVAFVLRRLFFWLCSVFVRILLQSVLQKLPKVLSSENMQGFGRNKLKSAVTVLLQNLASLSIFSLAQLCKSYGILIQLIAFSNIVRFLCFWYSFLYLKSIYLLGISLKLNSVYCWHFCALIFHF